MQRAASLLLDSSASLAEVAQQVGYDSEFAFNRAFKRELPQIAVRLPFVRHDGQPLSDFAQLLTEAIRNLRSVLSPPPRIRRASSCATTSQVRARLSAICRRTHSHMTSARRTR
jgi:hypothetical protein